MDHTRVTEWLRGWAKKQAAMNLLGGIATLFAGLALLAATWGFTYLTFT